jgi:predicted NBD/HSP70 family sugar kinase
VNTVLGVSVTPANVRSVLVEGSGADGATLDHDEFDVFEEVGAALRRARDEAEAGDHSVSAIGVTWSDDAEIEASMVLDGMARAGLTGVSAVSLSEAVEALASSIGRVIGYQRTALCVVEPDTAAIAVVDTADDSVDVLISHAIDSEGALIDWVGAALADDMRPDGLFMVGSVPGLDDTAATLESELDLPVFNPPEAELALAHGAALASADGTDADGLTLLPFDFSAPAAARPRRNPVAVPMTLLVAGAVTFVVSLSVAIGGQLGPSSEGVRTTSQEQQRSAGSPPQARPTPPSPVAPPPLAPPPVVAPVLVQDVAPIEALPPAPAPEFSAPEFVPEYVPEPPAAAPAPVPPPAAVMPPPPPLYQAPPQVPERRSLWDRFKDKLKPGPDGPGWQTGPGAVPPPGAPLPPG